MRFTSRCLLCDLELTPIVEGPFAGYETHPVSPYCLVRYTDNFGVAVDDPVPAPEDDSLRPDALDIDIKLFPFVDEVCKAIFERRGLQRLGGASSGKGWSSFCVTPDTPVLTADLRWIPAGDLVLGQMLIGFDEEPNGPGRHTEPSASGRFRGTRGKRKMRPSRVLHTGIIQQRVFRLELEDGTIIRASEKHPWLAQRTVTTGYEWIEVSELARIACAGQQVFLPRFFEPWSSKFTYEAGYLAGLFDGEGTLFLSGGKNQPSRGAHKVSFAQNDGIVLDTGISMLSSLGYIPSVKATNEKCQHVDLFGGGRATLRFLGEIRPLRLLEKWLGRVHEDGWIGELPRNTKLRVVNAVDEGIQSVVALQTSTQTYFASGFGAHNSTFQRCPWAWKRRYVDNERPHQIIAVESPSMAIGTIIHTFLAIYYLRMIEPGFPLTVEECKNELLAEANPELVNEAWKTFYTYALYYQHESIQPLAVELDLKHPRTKESCRYDLIAFFPDTVGPWEAGTYIIEHKSSARFDNDFLEGWANDGEVLGQIMLWQDLGLDRRYGELKGVMMNLLGRQKEPKLHRTFVAPQSWQIESHKRDLKQWDGLIQLAKSSNTFPHARNNCINRYGRCGHWNECATEGK